MKKLVIIALVVIGLFNISFTTDISRISALDIPFQDRDIFIDFDGINGESMDSDHMRWSNVQNVSQRYRSADPPDHSEIFVTVLMDSSWTQLHASMLVGGIISTAEIHYQEIGDVTYVSRKTNFTNVKLTGIEGGAPGFYIVRFIADIIKEETFDHLNSRTSVACWNYKLNISCS